MPMISIHILHEVRGPGQETAPIWPPRSAPPPTQRSMISSIHVGVWGNHPTMLSRLLIASLAIKQVIRSGPYSNSNQHLHRFPPRLSQAEAKRLFAKFA